MILKNLIKINEECDDKYIKVSMIAVFNLVNPYKNKEEKHEDNI